MVEARIPTAEEWMDREYLALKPESDLLTAIGRMADAEASAALVVGDDGKLLGILTEKDCLRVLTLETYHQALAGKVAEFMSPVPDCVEPEMDLFRISKRFLDTNFPVIPVLDDDRLVGQISRQAMLKAINATAHEIQAEHEKKQEVEDRSDENTDRPRSIEDMQKAFAAGGKGSAIRRFKRKG